MPHPLPDNRPLAVLSRAASLGPRCSCSAGKQDTAPPQSYEPLVELDDWKDLKRNEVRVKLSHYDLNAPAPAEANASFSFGSCVAWSKSIAIPSPAAVA